jgi:hypothetical protein
VELDQTGERQISLTDHWGVPKIHAMFEATYFASLRKRECRKSKAIPFRGPLGRYQTAGPGRDGQVRKRFTAGGRGIRTLGPARME